MDEVVYRSVGIICIVENVRDDIHRREEDAFRRFEDHLGVMTVGSRSLATIGGGCLEMKLFRSICVNRRTVVTPLR